MKKMLACILSACLLTAALSGCGGNETKTIRIYDGTFTGVLTAGEGVTAELLRAQGIPVYGESRVAELADPI